MKVQVRSMDELPCYTERDESLLGDEDSLGDEDYDEASENSGSLEETCGDVTINFSSDYSFSIYEAADEQCGQFKQYGNEQPRDSSCLEVNCQQPFGLLSSLETTAPIISSTSAEETNELGRQRSEQFATAVNDEENQQLAWRQSITVEVANKDRSKRWQFPSYNFTLSVVWTPFLLKAEVFEDINGVSSSEIRLYLDELDTKWTEQYKNFDYVVIAGGKWFLKTAIYHENNTVKGCHYCPGKNLTELGFDYAYRKALQLVLSFVTRLDQKAFVFLRTTTPDHFENGEWFSGGTCNRSVPFKEGEVEMRDIDGIMRDIELEEFGKATGIGAEKGVTLKLLDTTSLSLLRPDGHPGPYRQFQPFAKDKNAKVQNDCLHWCLPGPIDSWNDLLMEMMVDGING